MRTILTIIMAVVTFISAGAYTFNYTFHNTPVSEAIVKISKEHPDINISFIYKELDNYRTSARIRTDDVYDALRQITGLNPVSVIRRDNDYFIEALQHGKFVYSGRVMGSDKEPVAGATVMLLAPKDSTVITYGIAGADGRFTIPCDRRNVIAKASCMGYHSVTLHCPNFYLGNIVMPVNATLLRQVSVEGQAATAYPDRTVYVPSTRQKNASQNAIDLLRHMAIPQIEIDAINNSVTSNTGGDVSIFINYVEASGEEMEGMRMADVRRIEYLEFPVDPRFHGAQRVINIILQEYEYGGYTKLSANEGFLVGLSSQANVFSKFSYKKMTYDVYVSARNRDKSHNGYDALAEYSLKDAEGKDYTLLREEKTDKDHSRQDNYPVTFRATYNTKKVQIRNTLGYSHLSSPFHDQSGSLAYLPANDENHTFSRNNKSHSNSVNYNGSFYLALPNDLSVSVRPQVSFTHNNNSMSYVTSVSDAILRNAREDAYFFRADATLTKRLGKKHSFMLTVDGGKILNRLQYTGNASYSDRFGNPFADGEICYNLKTNKVSLYADAGVIWEQSDINGIVNNDVYPFTHINLGYAPDSKNSISAYIQFANNTPGINQKASDLLRDNEFMYVTGNPLLKNSRHFTFNVGYTWLPSNMFALNAYGNFYELFNKSLTTYLPYEDGRALLRTYVNSGDYIRGMIGVSANLKLFDKSLQLNLNARQRFNHSTGVYDMDCNPFEVRAQVIYYLNQFYFQALYETSKKSMSNQAPRTSKSPSYYYIVAGWGNSDLNVRLTAYNMFNSSWKSGDVYIESPLYSERRTSFDTNYHARLSLSVTYTFGYGKKVKRGNEVGEQEGVGSAIIY